MVEPRMLFASAKAAEPDGGLCLLVDQMTTDTLKKLDEMDTQIVDLGKRISLVVEEAKEGERPFEGFRGGTGARR